MAEFEPTASPSGMPARARYPRKPGMFPIGGQSEPMQRALDAWYREQPDAFTHSREAATAVNALDPAERAIALNHLLTYGRLTSERELVSLRDGAAGGRGPVLSPLLARLEAQNAELMARAPIEIHHELATGLAASTQGLIEKAAAVDTASSSRRQSEAFEQSVLLGEALLRQDPAQYEALVADAGAMIDGLGLEDKPRRALGESVRKRLAVAALTAQADPVGGNPDAAAADLERGRFRDAFDPEEVVAWRELVAANQTRATVEAARQEQNAGIVAEIRMSNRLAAAGRAEAPMPTLGEIEAVFPGEGAGRVTTATQNQQRSLYVAEIATQSAEQESAWIEAATSEADRAIRVEAVQQKHRDFVRSGGGNVLKLYPALNAAIEDGLRDFAELDPAIDAYQRQLGRLGVPPEERSLLPTESLQQLADQYGGLNPPHDRLLWLDKLLNASGELRSKTILQAIARVRPGFDPNAIRALDALADSADWMSAITILTRSERDEDYVDGYQLEVRLNPETRKYEDWEVSPQGRERVRPRRYAGAFFKVETRVDPSTGSSYEIEVFPDGSERPRLPADENYPPLRGMALETWLTAAYEQHTNPATWRLATPADERVQKVYRDAGWLATDWYFVGPNAVVYERSEITEEPSSTQAAHAREALENRDLQDAALKQAVASGNFNDLLGASLGPAGFLGAGIALGTKAATNGKWKYSVVPSKIRLGIEGINTKTHPAFAEYRKLNDTWVKYRDDPINKSSDTYKGKNIELARAAGLEFQRAALGLIDPTKFTIVGSPRLKIDGVESYAVPDGSFINPRDGLKVFVEVKSTNLTDPKGLPPLSYMQQIIYPRAAAQGRQVLLIFQRNNKIVVECMSGEIP